MRSTAACRQPADTNIPSTNIPGRGRRQVRCSRCGRLLGLVTPSDGGAQVEIKCARCKKNNTIWV